MARTRASAKKAGTYFESQIASFLSESLGYKIIRMPKTGARDTGDLYGVTRKKHPVAIECKNPGEKSAWSVSQWWAETQEETINAGAEVGFLIINQHRKSIEDSLCVVDEATWNVINGDEIIPQHSKKSAIGFNKWYENIEDGACLKTKRRGLDDHWVVFHVKHLHMFVDSTKNIESIILSPEELEKILSHHQITLTTSHGNKISVNSSS